MKCKNCGRRIIVKYHRLDVEELVYCPFCGKKLKGFKDQIKDGLIKRIKEF